MPSKRRVPEQQIAELSDEMVRLAGAKDAEIAKLTELLNIVRLTDHPPYELGYQEGGSSVVADISCAFDEVLELEVGGAWDAAEKARAVIEALKEQRDAARDYLIRHVLQPLHPHINPLPDLIGVCTQVDNLMAGVVEHQDALTEQRDRAMAALRKIESDTIDHVAVALARKALAALDTEDQVEGA